MRVLVLGSTGAVGFPIAQALVRAGHDVWGMTRSESKCKILASEEIHPIVGEVGVPEKWIDIIATVDIVIDAVGGPNTPVLLEALSAACTNLRPSSVVKMSYIYTSGTWVHGEDRTNIVTDTTPITKPADLVSWRPPVEQLVLRNTVMNTIVIRPSLVYGRGGSLLGSLFEQAASGGEILWPALDGGRYAVIHMDDLADFYVRAAESAPVLGGKIFDASNSTTESHEDVLRKLVEVSGAKGYKMKKPEGAYETALSQTSLVRPYLGRSLLGWEPRKPGLVEGLPVYYATWKALNDK